MTAKFAGKCRTCKGRIEAGQTIRWAAGQGAECATCAGIAATASAPVATGYKCGQCGRRHAGQPAHRQMIDTYRMQSIMAGAMKTGERELLVCLDCIRSANDSRIAEYREARAEAMTDASRARWDARIALVTANRDRFDPERTVAR